MDTDATIFTDAEMNAQAEYWRSPEFQAYQIAMLDWEGAKAAYVLNPSDANFLAEHAAHRIMHAHLAAARALPIHKTAFGW